MNETVDWPVAKITVGEDETVTATVYAPGLPPGEYDLCLPRSSAEAGESLTDERIEAAYWEFDARHKGYPPFKGLPETERDAFKHTIRRLLAGEKAIP